MRYMLNQGGGVVLSHEIPVVFFHFILRIFLLKRSPP